MANNAPDIILASASRARRDMLQETGLDFKSVPASIDETALLKKENNPEAAARILAREKALAVSKQNPGALVIGSDQILECEGTMFEKAKSENDAREKLKTLRGKTHRLISAVSIAKDGTEIWSASDEARLTMRAFDDAFLEAYLKTAGEDITACVGAYALEKSGAWLFSDIKGNYHTILGMPLLPLLEYLNREHGLMP